MSTESDAQREYAMPRLVGAPAYVPRRNVEETPRPLDPDDLPLEAFRTDDERALAASLPTDVAIRPSPRPAAAADPGVDGSSDDPPARASAGRFGLRR